MQSKNQINQKSKWQTRKCLSICLLMKMFKITIRKMKNNLLKHKKLISYFHRTIKNLKKLNRIINNKKQKGILNNKNLKQRIKMYNRIKVRISLINYNNRIIRICKNNKEQGIK